MRFFEALTSLRNYFNDPLALAANEKSAKLDNDTIEIPDELWEEIKGL